MVLLIQLIHHGGQKRSFIYIPLWFYLYDFRRNDYEKQGIYLHSTMVLLIQGSRRRGLPFQAHLHSTMVLLIRYDSDTNFSFFLIYIPLWFYLYPAPNRIDRTSPLFTFHYGSTYTCLTVTVISVLFYLHSTMVLLIQWKTWCSRLPEVHLHSTMVLLIQRYRCFRIDRLHNLHSTMVLLIPKQPCLLPCRLLIYIPLWFYLYSRSPSVVDPYPHLHSTMVLLIRFFCITRVLRICNLHSTMVLLIRRTDCICRYW